MTYIRSLIALFFLTIILATSLNSTKNSKYERYKIEKAEIKYKISGLVNGKKTLVFDQFGMREKEITKATVDQNDMLEQIHMASYILLDKYYDMSLISKIGNENSMQPYFDYADSIGKKNLLDIQYETIVQKGFIVEDGGKILGKVTQKFSSPNKMLNLWIWNNIRLKEERKSPQGVMLIEATSINEKPTITKSTFDLPKDVKFDKK